MEHWYSHISTFDEFARRLAKRFDRKREVDYFRDLTALRPFGVVDEFMIEFQGLAIMTHHLSKERLVFIFVEGLAQPLSGMVKVSSPRSLDDAIRAAYDLEPTVKSLRGDRFPRGRLIGSHFQNA